MFDNEFKIILENIQQYTENEFLEFKVNKFDPEYIWETISAISNSVSYKGESFWYIIFWVSDDKEIIWTKILLSEKKVWNEPFESWIHHNLSPNINFEFISYEYDNRNFQIIKIPSARNEIIKFKWKSYKGKWNWVWYIRIWQTKQIIDNHPDIIKSILNKNIDWSGLSCEWSNLDDLDEEAIIYLRERLSNRKEDKKWLDMPLKNLLNSIWLLKNGIPNNTCILFLWKTDISNKYINERNKISWRYIDEKNDIEERMSIEEQKAPLLLTLEKIKYHINRFNTYLKDIDLFRTDIRQYDEKATIEELLVNALVHRDWNIKLWNEVIQTPISLEFRNPWIFRADLQKVLKENQAKEYINPVMAEFFQHINLMEKERWWLQKAYKAQLKKWTTINFYQRDNRVDFIVSWRIENEDFAKLVFKKTDINLDDLLLLDKITSERNAVNTDLTKDEAYNLKKKWYIEIRGTRTQKCYISGSLSKILWKTGAYVRKKWVKTQQKYNLVLEHIDEFGKIRLSNLKDMFPELTYDQCKKILVNMKKKWLIKLIKEWRRDKWYYLNLGQ